MPLPLLLPSGCSEPVWIWSEKLLKETEWLECLGGSVDLWDTARVLLETPTHPQQGEKLSVSAFDLNRLLRINCCC